MYRLEVFTSGYPRSGNTWLDRILSDLLCAPMQETPDVDKKTVYADNIIPERYVIRKTHWRPHEYLGVGFNNGPSRMVFIHRDPRDVAVSVMHYRDKGENLEQIIRGMVEPCSNADEHIFKHGRYQSIVGEWLLSGRADVVIKYEDLHSDFINVVESIARALPVPVTEQMVLAVEVRQRFDKWKPTHPHSMRKGIVGDWRNFFKRCHGEMITDSLGELMQSTGYVNDLDWWRDLEE